MSVESTPSEQRPAVAVHRIVRRLAFAVARWAGVYIVTPETLLEWAQRAAEHTKIAGDYDRGDQRLCGLNDGRAESLNRCVAQVVRENTPNGKVTHE